MAATFENIRFELRDEMLNTRGELYKIFEGFFVRSLFSQIQTSYRDRSMGRADKYGNTWAPLSPRTIKWKRGRGFGRTAERRLVETGESLRSFTPGKANTRGYTPSNPDQIFRRNGNSIKIGSRVGKLAKAQTRGPGRPVFAPGMMDTIVERAIRVALGKLTQYMRQRYK